MKTSNNGIKLICYFEGLRLEAYKDQAGIPTIGYGHTKGVKLGTTISRYEANQFLQQDLHYHEEAVNNLVFATINNNQFDALVSFCYNEGPLKFKSSTLLKRLNNGSPLAAANELSKWVYAAGVIDPGLVKRRALEKVLFLTPMDEEFEVPKE